jgi:hypothetical protein
VNFDLFLDIHLFCKSKGITPTTFGKLAVNDQKLVTELKRGRTPKPETVARIRAFMEAA